MPRLLVQLSDTHIKLPGRLAYGRVDTAAFLAKAVDAVNRLPQAAEAVIVTGDLADSGRLDEYAYFGELLAPLRCPIYLIPGNHDDRESLRRAFPTHRYLQEAESGEFVQYAISLAGLRLVTVDTVVPNEAHGEVCERRLAWLDATLREEPTTPTIVAMHHPPFATFIGHMDRVGLLRGADELREVIARHAQVERVICGHLHRSIQARWGRTVAMTAPSTAHQVALDLALDGLAAFTMEPPGFLVHAWSGTREVASHLAFTEPFAGPYPFD